MEYSRKPYLAIYKVCSDGHIIVAGPFMCWADIILSLETTLLDQSPMQPGEILQALEC